MSGDVQRAAFVQVLEKYIVQRRANAASPQTDRLFDDADYAGVQFYDDQMTSPHDVDSFPAVLAEALDSVKVEQYTPRQAAERVILALADVYKYNGIFPWQDKRISHEAPTDRCPICLENLANDHCCQLSCQHLLHTTCAQLAWEHGHFVCPTCRAPVQQVTPVMFRATTQNNKRRRIGP